uniref:Uncharacterized protein n=1 Tax=Steinernema glaseri TaxID=37863 RepID=A0A1I7YYW8_9BILA
MVALVNVGKRLLRITPTPELRGTLWHSYKFPSNSPQLVYTTHYFFSRMDRWNSNSSKPSTTPRDVLAPGQQCCELPLHRAHVPLCRAIISGGCLALIMANIIRLSRAPRRSARFNYNNCIRRLYLAIIKAPGTVSKGTMSHGEQEEYNGGRQTNVELWWWRRRGILAGWEASNPFHKQCMRGEKRSLARIISADKYLASIVRYVQVLPYPTSLLQ